MTGCEIGRHQGANGERDKTIHGNQIIFLCRTHTVIISADKNKSVSTSLFNHVLRNYK